MDARLAFLIAFGVAGIWAYFETQPGYAEAWLMIGIISLGWAAVAALRNWRRGPGKRMRKR